jgi:GAF domain-containing protein
MDVNLERSGPAEILPAVEQFQRRLSLLRYGHRDEGGSRRAQDALLLLWATHGTDTLVTRLLDSTLGLTGADRGNVQLMNRDKGALEIAAQVGFDHEFLEYFEFVDDDFSACGRAARLRSQTVVIDTATDLDFRPHSEIAQAAGFRSVQSTPLVDGGGTVVGMLSTHYERPGRPPDADLRALRVYGQLAGETLSQLLGSSDEENASPNPFAEILPVLADLECGKTALARLADIAIHRIHAASLDLSALQTDLTDHILHVRLASALAELDHVIRDLRNAALESRP